MHDLQNHVYVKDSFKLQDRSINFNVTECEKFIVMVQIPHCD